MFLVMRIPLMVSAVRSQISVDAYQSVLVGACRSRMLDDLHLYSHEFVVQKINTSNSFIYGWKTQYGSPAGLLEIANSTIPKDGDETDNIIFVCILVTTSENSSNQCRYL